MRSDDRSGRLSKWERIALTLVFAGLVITSGIVVSQLGSDDDVIVRPPEERPVVSANVPRPVSLLDAYEVAVEWSREWNSDAQLILVSSQFEFPLNADMASPEASAGALLFTFAAPKDGDVWPRLTLAVSRQSGTIYFEDELASGVRPPDSIATVVEELPVTAEQAFRIADEVVGRDYREGCEASRSQVQVILDSTDPDEPVWVVVFYDQRERNVNDIVMRIDAHTGATTTEERDDPTCTLGE